MDYERLSVGGLRDACQARGLGTARSRAELIQRLTDHDKQAGDNAQPETPAVPDAPTSPVAVYAGAFQQAFDAEPGGPDEETHLAYRQATIQAATEVGFQTRGDARLAATRDGMWVYEVSVRQVT